MADTDQTTIRGKALQVGDTVRMESDDGTMGPARIIAIAMNRAWCFYPKANAHRVHGLQRLQRVESSASPQPQTEA